MTGLFTPDEVGCLYRNRFFPGDGVLQALAAGSVDSNRISVNSEDKKKIIATLVKRVDHEHPLPYPIVDLIIFHLFHFYMTIAEAETGFKKLKKAFIDWNEARISSIGEIRDAFAPPGRFMELALNISDILKRIHKDRSMLSLEFLADVPKSEFKQYFKKLGCVDRSTRELILNTRRKEPIVPLDRKSASTLARIGLVPKKLSIVQKRIMLQGLISASDAVSFHRSVLEIACCWCTGAQNGDGPELSCGKCPGRRVCTFYGRRKKRKAGKGNKRTGNQ